MRRFFIVMITLLSLSVVVNAKKEKKNDVVNITAVTVVSDTASCEENTDSIDMASVYNGNHNVDGEDDAKALIKDIVGDTASTTGIVAIVFFFVFMLLISPFIIIGLVCYYIFRSRKREKVNMYSFSQPQTSTGTESLGATTADAQENAQREGASHVNSSSTQSNYSKPMSDEYVKMYSSGMIQVFTGIGLAVFFILLTGSWGLFGIGILVMCIGIGKVITAMNLRKKRDEFDGRKFN